MCFGRICRYMCNRHVPHLIAEYEASKRDDVEADVAGDEEEQPNTDSTAVERKRLFGSLVARLTS